MTIMAAQAMARRTRLFRMAAVTVAAVIAAALVPRIPQAPGYHRLADSRTLLGIPNFANVVSNLPFLIVGVWGLLFVLKKRGSQVFLDPVERRPYALFFLGVALTCFGSAFYHWAPDNCALVWDRLPMTLLFMAILSATIAERISVRAGAWLLLPLAAAGIASVLYWRLTELQGAGDLRAYGFVQFFPLLAIPLLLLLFPARYTRTMDLAVALAIYGGAKVSEVCDQAIFKLSHAVSGHTLKHVTAALAAYWILQMLWKRQPVPRPKEGSSVLRRSFSSPGL